MAKLGSINRNLNRARMAKNQLSKRNSLREKSLDMKLPEEERILARLQLQKMPRNGSATRVRNRCSITGRPRAYYRKFGLCRNKFRELSHEGKIPGVTKASW